MILCYGSFRAGKRWAKGSMFQPQTKAICILQHKNCCLCDYMLPRPPFIRSPRNPLMLPTTCCEKVYCFRIKVSIHLVWVTFFSCGLVLFFLGYFLQFFFVRTNHGMVAKHSCTMVGGSLGSCYTKCRSL